MQNNDLTFLMPSKIVIKFESDLGILSSIKRKLFGYGEFIYKYQIRLYYKV